ncbi:energy-coupling factor transporter transmembrane protein EcfT [candidate division KSB1 bacterium]|nr:energy-coupling factor transporter transmembrane protein EcfT [candidate division KSB1 bacterium]
MAFLSDITLGHYYPSDSFIHRLDPRTKLLATMLLMMTCMISQKPIVLAVFGVILLVAVYLSKIPVRFILKNLRPFAVLFLITLFVHMFWTSGTILYTVPELNIEITREGLYMGVVYSARLALLVVFAALLTLSTSPIELTDAMEKMLAPLKRLRVPTHEIVMMLTLSLRFIPTLMEEAERLKNAQISRGATFDGPVYKRIKNVIPLILPLFISSFRRADELALAMDARCYHGGEGRTSFKKLKYTRNDVVIFCFCCLFFIFGVWKRF